MILFNLQDFNFVNCVVILEITWYIAKCFVTLYDANNVVGCLQDVVERSMMFWNTFWFCVMNYGF